MTAVVRPPAAPGVAQDMMYGLLGLPLAFVALPLYVVLPNHYAREFGVPLATLGAILLGARLFDAALDPLIGRFTDHLFARSVRCVLAWGAVSAVVLWTGFVLLFFPPVREPAALLPFTFATLVVTYAAFSALSVAHQSWGAMLGGGEARRGRIVAWREGLGLAGVLLATGLATVAGLQVAAGVFLACLLCGWVAWTRAPRPVPARRRAGFDLWLPLSRPGFRRLLAAFVINGIASAIPATLVLFFVQDRLQAPRGMEPAFLGCYFLCAALSIPLWLRLVARIGLARSWLCGMALSISVFIWAALLGAGDLASFMVVCALSGAALGTDLALPGAMLSGEIADAGDRGQAEGAYFGWWNFATKLNLALAAGLSLPLLGQFGYVPGSRDVAGLQALTVAYCLVPCLLKLGAAAVLYGGIIRRGSAPHAPPSTPSH